MKLQLEGNAAHRFSSFRSVSWLSVLSSYSLQPPGLSRTKRLDSRYSSSSPNSSAIRMALIGFPAAWVRRNVRHSRCRERTQSLWEMFIRLSALFQVMVHSKLSVTGLSGHTWHERKWKNYCGYTYLRKS